MAISYVGGAVGTASGSTTTDITVALNSGLTGGSSSAVSEGDLVVVTVCLAHSDDAPTAGLVSSGYTSLTQLNADNTRDTSLGVHYKFMGATPDTSVVISRSGNIENSIAWTVQVFAGVDSTTPMDVAAVGATGTGTALADPPAITPTTSGAWIVINAGGNNSGTELYTWSGDFVNTLSAHASDTQDAVVGSAYYTGWTSGSYDPAATTTGGTLTSASWCAYTLALRPAGAGPATISASLALTTGAATLAATGTVDVAAAAAIVTGAATLAATGTVDVVGDSAVTTGSATLVAIGTVDVVGDAAITTGAATLEATGLVGDVITGDAAITTGAATLAATGTVDVVGSAAITTGAATLSADGTVTGGVPTPEPEPVASTDAGSGGQRKKFKIPTEEPEPVTLDKIFGEPVRPPVQETLVDRVVLQPVSFGNMYRAPLKLPEMPRPLKIVVAQTEHDDLEDIARLIAAIM